MIKPAKKHSAFTLAEGGQSPLLNLRRPSKHAFTLAEVLITLGVIGVVAAITMPTLITNIQERVRQEQVRTVKYKFTKATEKMNSLGLIGQYGTPSENDATEKFVEELKKHMTISKICKNNELDKCWPTGSIYAYQNGSTTLSSFAVKELKKGVNLKALALGTKNTETVGIVTGDGVPMLLVYSPQCSGFDEAKTYTWSVQDGKPVTNATTNCVSAIFDINGSKGPNKIGTDVRTLNSLFGSTDLGVVEGVTSEQCEKVRTKYGINACCTRCDSEDRKDTWAAGVIACAELGLHLPDMMTLANIANSRYGTTLIGPYTIYMGTQYGENCRDQIAAWYGASSYIFQEAEIICNVSANTDSNSALNDGESSTAPTLSGNYWSSSEAYTMTAYNRTFGTNSRWDKTRGRYGSVKSLCVGD